MLAYHLQVSPRTASIDVFHEPQQSHLAQQSSQALGKEILYSREHILEQEFQILRVAKNRTVNQPTALTFVNHKSIRPRHTIC